MTEEFNDALIEEEPKSNKNLILIIVAVVAVLCICCICLSLVVPTLLGPTIGNVFSEINNGMVP